MSYIDRDKLKKQLAMMRRRLDIDEENDLNLGLQATDILDDVVDEIDYIADADVQEVKHGKWERREEYHGYLGCSECHNAFIMREWVQNGKWNYCPTCGARMELSE